METDLLSTPEVCKLVGCSYRMADYWVRREYVTPTINGKGSGSKRWWSREDAAELRAIQVLTQLGCEDKAVYRVMEALRSNPRLWSGSLLIDHHGNLVASGSGWLLDAAACRDRVGADPVALAS